MRSIKIKIIVLTALILVSVGSGYATESSGKLTASLEKALANQPENQTIWIHFTDKDLTPDQMSSALLERSSELGQKTNKRRARSMPEKQMVTEADLPVAPAYLELIDATGAHRRQASRWLNAASYEASSHQISMIADFPFVKGIDLVKGGRSDRPEPLPDPTDEAKAVLRAAQAEKNENLYLYGACYPGLQQINVPAAHATGLSGKGVTIAILDSGFDLTHECLQDLDVVDAWDFVNGDGNVGNEDDENPNQTLYGTAALSILAGYSQSNIIGTAYGASVILAKTEYLDDETSVEEDNWIAALEWAEELGADIVNSGLGYFYWYDYSDLDGHTAFITVAAEMAVARGVVVVNGAGDQGLNPEFPHVIPPSDGPNVLAIGAINLSNHVVVTSGPGPTYDNRIKPDFMALGSGTAMAFSRASDMYYYGYGTNYATPLVAGVVALMLEQNPHLNPSQIREALRETASRNIMPDNYYGWGSIDALAAIQYWAPRIEHTPLSNIEPGHGYTEVNAVITSSVGLDQSGLYVVWRRSGMAWNMDPLVQDSGDNYSANIYPQPDGTVVEYYLVAKDSNGYTRHSPESAPGRYYTFEVADDTTAPTINHIPLVTQAASTWPPVVKAEVIDNVGVSSVTLRYSIQEGHWEDPVPMILVDDHWELPFPWEWAIQDLEFNYMIMAQDTAPVPNFSFIGPYLFSIREHRGRVLIVDDHSNLKSSKTSREPDAISPVKSEKTIDTIQQWLIDAGYHAEVLSAEEIGSTSFLDFDAVMVSSGGSYSPLLHPELRRTMVAWAENGGRILVEGGEVAYAASQPYDGYPEVMEKVLHANDYMGDDASILHPPMAFKDHYLVTRPHQISVPVIVDNSNGGDWGATDLVSAADDATVVMQAGYGSNHGGIICHDENTCPDGGQTVFFTFNLLKIIEYDAREILDNAMTYLLQAEPAGNSSISGRIKRVGETDHSGIIVRAGRNHSAITAVDGSYFIEGLWGGNYRVTADEQGFIPVFQDINLTDDTSYAGVNLYLYPAVEVSYPDAPHLPIPDNNPDGIERIVSVNESGELVGIEIQGDISHFSVGQLKIKITSPMGTTVTLHNLTGGTADDLVGTWPLTLFVDGPGTLDDFLGEDPQGDWIYQVADTQFGASGTLNSWSLDLVVRARSTSSVDTDFPAKTRLLGNTPNPFNPQTQIAFELATPGPVSLKIYDIKGRLVRTLAQRNFLAGPHKITWNGRDNNGAQPASGFYFCRLETKGITSITKMMMVR